jgi:hypothetical protein
MVDLFFPVFLLRGPIRKTGSWRSAAPVFAFAQTRNILRPVRRNGRDWIGFAWPGPGCIGRSSRCPSEFGHVETQSEDTQSSDKFFILNTIIWHGSMAFLLPGCWERIGSRRFVASRAGGVLQPFIEALRRRAAGLVRRVS